VYILYLRPFHTLCVNVAISAVRTPKLSLTKAQTDWIKPFNFGE